MTEPRIIQNFVGYRAVIATGSREANTALEAAVTKLGLEVIYPEIGCGDSLAEHDWAAGDYVVFVDTDHDSALEIPVSAQKVPMVPVIGLVGVAAPSRLKFLVQFGATATLGKPVHGGSVYAALFIGVNEFRRRRALAERLDELERRRRGRKYLIKAILHLMQTQQCDEDQAYVRLRRESMRHRLGLEDYCETLVRGFPDADGPILNEQGKKRADRGAGGR